MSEQLLDTTWQYIRKEAGLLAEKEPVLANFFEKNILQHTHLASALGYILAYKLSNLVITKPELRNIINVIYEHNPEIVASAVADIVAVRERDPAVELWSTPLLYLKGFHALQSYRIAHCLWQQDRQSLAIFLQNQISTSFDVDIHPAARIGKGVMLDHATGIVIGETSVIENNVSILQGVTLGGTGKENGDRHPKVQEGVLIGAGAKILGNIKIGRYAKIGACSVVLQSIPEYATAAGVPAKIIGHQKSGTNPAFEMDHNLNFEI